MARRAPVDAGKDRIGSFADLMFVLRQTRPALWLAGSACLLTLAEVGASLLFPLLTGGIVDRLGQSDMSGSAVLADPALQLLCLVLVTAALAGAASRYMLATTGLAIVASLKNKMIERLVRAPVGCVEKQASGEHASRVMNDSRTLSQLVSRETLNAASGLLLLVGTAIILFTLDTPLAAVLFGVIGVAFLISLPIIMALAGIAYHLQEVTARLSARLTQVFAEIRLVKAFGGESIEQSNGERDVQALFKLGRRAARIESSLQPIITLAVTGSLIAILAYGGIRVAQGSLSAGTLTAFLLYVFAVVGPLAQLSSFFSQLSAARGASARMADVLRLPAEPSSAPSTEKPDALPAPQPLIFDSVRFAYPDSPAPAVVIDSLRLEAGSKTAIIGPSGCGKSTLLALIERFYAPDSGCIRYGDTDIAALALSEWRARIGYVSQSPAMMAGTVRENVLYGIDRPVAPHEIDRALRLARCCEFVGRLGDGLDTRVGEQGATLSGGQRQRLALARMFLRNPEILLLDEATSQLDEENEFLVVQGLRELMQGRTSIFVTHRMGLVEHMDRIIMLDEGRVVGSGDHRGLLDSNAAYRRVVDRAFATEEL
jgi:ATP-binding cassette, subfamily B, bacterial AbcA/BmrA